MARRRKKKTPIVSNRRSYFNQSTGEVFAALPVRHETATIVAQPNPARKCFSSHRTNRRKNKSGAKIFFADRESTNGGNPSVGATWLVKVGVMWVA